VTLAPGLYGIADAAFGDPVALGRALLAGGVRTLQLRCKGWPVVRVAQAAAALEAPCAARGVTLVINDHPSLVRGLRGLHLGQDDGGFDRSSLPPGCLVGRSTHDLGQLARAEIEGVDYVGFGPVFATRTKVGAPPARGLDRLREAVEQSSLPVVAIGGITAENLASVRATGVHAWAVISAILAAPDVAAAAMDLG